MGFQEDIDFEQSKINDLRASLPQLRFPARTINFQHANASSIRNVTPLILSTRRARGQVREKIGNSERKIESIRKSFSEAILGV